MADAGALTVSAEFDDAIAREWARIANPSSFFTGAERVALATEVRRERVGDPRTTGQVSEAATEAARPIRGDGSFDPGLWSV